MCNIFKKHDCHIKVIIYIGWGRLLCAGAAARNPFSSMATLFHSLTQRFYNMMSSQISLFKERGFTSYNHRLIVVHLSESSLTLALGVENKNTDQPFDFTTALHTYIR